MLRFHLPDTLVDTLYRLVFIHRLYVHYNFGIRDIKEIGTPSVSDTQRVIGNGEDRRFRSIHLVSIRLELDLIRHDPIL